MNRDLTVGKPSRVLCQFCLPLFGSIIFQQLYNIADSFVAGKFIGEDALAAVTVLTAYIPLLTDTGGNAGSQSTSTIIRGMALGDIEPKDLLRILWRECRAAILCGGTLAILNFLKLIALDGIAAPVAAVVCLTLICTVLLSQIIGGFLPVVAEKFHLDPAVMASPLITTIVDTTTLLVYFNIARTLLKI